MYMYMIVASVYIYINIYVNYMDTCLIFYLYTVFCLIVNFFWHLRTLEAYMKLSKFEDERST